MFVHASKEDIVDRVLSSGCKQLWSQAPLCIMGTWESSCRGRGWGLEGTAERGRHVGSLLTNSANVHEGGPPREAAAGSHCVSCLCKVYLQRGGGAHMYLTQISGTLR